MFLYFSRVLIRSLLSSSILRLKHKRLLYLLLITSILLLKWLSSLKWASFSWLIEVTKDVRDKWSLRRELIKKGSDSTQLPCLLYVLFSFSLSSVSFPSKLSSPLRSAKKIFIIYSSKVSEILCESLILLSSTINFSSKKLREASLSLSGVGTRTILSLSTSFIIYFSTSTSLGNAIQSSTYLIYFSMIAIRFLRSGCLPTLVLNVLNKSIKDFRSYWETPKYFSVWILISTSTATPNELT